ncbi:MAG TPA: hypothetical protein VFF51_04070, partial [Candidatus Methylomirabilis sp.]|nr:hypothetical protein [Candidatus Methylomirabilis sp.]
AGASFSLNLAQGATSAPLGFTFTPPAQVKTHILVFQGRLGNEGGAVAAKVKQVPLNAFFLWHVRFYNDQFELVSLGSTSTGDCFQRLRNITVSGKHTGLRRDYLFFAFVDHPNPAVSPLDVSALELTGRISPSPPHIPQAADYSTSNNKVVGIIHPAGEATCTLTGQSSPYAPRVMALELTSQIAPEFFASTPIPPPNHYVYMDALDLFRDTGAVASEPVVLTQKLTSISLDQIQQITQGLHPLLVPPPSFPKSGAVYAFAQVDIPNVDSWELQVTDSIGAIWGGTTPIASTSVAEMWDLQSLALLASGEAAINLDVLSALHQRIRGYELQWVFGPQYQATLRRGLDPFTLRHNPNNPFNPIRESIP